MWLRDEVAKTADRARVLLYGYDTSLVDSDSFQDIGDIATRLSSDINAIRGERFVSIALSRKAEQWLTHYRAFSDPRRIGAEPHCLCCSLSRRIGCQRGSSFFFSDNQSVTNAIW